MAKDRFGYGNYENDDTIGYMMRDEGTELVKKAYTEYDREVANKVISHFINTGEYISKENMTPQIKKYLDKEVKNITGEHDWISEIYVDIKRGHGKWVN